MNPFQIHVQQDFVICKTCGHDWVKVWSGQPVAVLRFPIECPECHNMTGYRRDEPQVPADDEIL